MESCKEASTLMPSSCYMDADVAGKGVDQTKYRGLIGSLLYLTASRPHIMFFVCPCAIFQANPKESHLTAAKRILKYLKGTTNIQACVALSTAEAEYIATGSCCAQILWVKQ